jgi:hypothetical protein
MVLVLPPTAFGRDGPIPADRRYTVSQNTKVRARILSRKVARARQFWIHQIDFARPASGLRLRCEPDVSVLFEQVERRVHGVHLPEVRLVGAEAVSDAKARYSLFTYPSHDSLGILYAGIPLHQIEDR